MELCHRCAWENEGSKALRYKDGFSPWLMGQGRVCSVNTCHQVSAIKGTVTSFIVQPFAVPKDSAHLQSVGSNKRLAIPNLPGEKLRPASAPSIPVEDSLKGL